jgi:hypothetical protein
MGDSSASMSFVGVGTADGVLCSRTSADFLQYFLQSLSDLCSIHYKDEWSTSRHGRFAAGYRSPGKR